MPSLNAQCLISRAFVVFRKSALLEMNAYDTDTVGEDIELALRLQDGGYQRYGNQIVYDPTLFAIPESHIVSKDYCINGIDGKEG